ncbi:MULTISPECIES: hypothetical protein [Planktothricoides]|uniref:Uncharacterized protein n=2 Tax=Planktothricoides raciborskii TaxID=132608 RepID=A0AAU8JG59_9CYAN|nr:MULTISPECIES: hypothetical protein [Planktothricoides]KOR34992.1 hypothetical protein AM228_20960 [Planktothricoides sp. SR001]MBD2544764.1 hypothetical protein [Planktothricoides raciborskii FACHB-1370]MBD2582829.1 hypothetical protein [Planktothricoides raciborskii FACHB-1261]
MNQGSPKLWSLTLSDFSRLLVPLLIIWLLASIGLGWLVNSFLILVGLLLISPVIAVFVLRWWVSRNVITDQCPVCDYEFTGLNQAQFQCPNCGETLKVENRQFQRVTPPGTIDVQAVEVSSSPVDN